MVYRVCLEVSHHYILWCEVNTQKNFHCTLVCNCPGMQGSCSRISYYNPRQSDPSHVQILSTQILDYQIDWMH